MTLNPTFDELPLAEPIQRALCEKNYTTPSPIQAQAIPILLEGGDLLGCAQTGTGKTAAFCLPILHRLSENRRQATPRHARALILTPTRELAVQIERNLNAYGKHLPLRHAVVYGGVGFGAQIRAMSRGVDILVATPGRLLDLMGQGQIRLGQLEILVLDEADRMLDMGFIHDVRRILATLPAQRQSLFFSATLAPAVIELAESILVRPARVTIAPTVTTAEKVDQRVCFVEHANKPKLLTQLLDEQKDASDVARVLVFSRTKHGANRLAQSLTKTGYRAEAIHGNKSQAARQKALDMFRAGRVPVLVATDVAARGIDVKGITLVVNYDLPLEPESYVHRIGRTARAGAAGLAVSLCGEDELGCLRGIEKMIRQQIPVLAEQPFHEEGLAYRYAQGRQGRRPEAPRRNGNGNGHGSRFHRGNGRPARQRFRSRFQ